MNQSSWLEKYLRNRTATELEKIENLDGKVSKDTAEQLAVLSRLKGDDKHEIVLGKDICSVTVCSAPRGGDYVVVKTKDKILEYRFSLELTYKVLLTWIQDHNFLATKARKHSHLSVIE